MKGKKTFENFLEEYPMYSKFEFNKAAKLTFEELSKDENIISMIDASNMDKPAISGIVKDLELFIDNFQDDEFFLENNFTKQTIGTMIKVILDPFGYTVSKQKDIGKKDKGKYFKSASCYEKTKAGRLKIDRRVVRA